MDNELLNWLVIFREMLSSREEFTRKHKYYEQADVFKGLVEEIDIEISEQIDAMVQDLAHAMKIVSRTKQG